MALVVAISLRLNLRPIFLKSNYGFHGRRNNLAIANKLRQIANNYDLFPLESNKSVVLKNIYSEFCILVLISFFIHVFFLDSRDVVMLFLLIIIYLMCLILMIRSFLFKDFNKNNFFRVLWYVALILCVPTLSSYTILSGKGNDAITITAILSILILYFLTNSNTFTFCLLTGFGLGAGLYQIQHVFLEAAGLPDFIYITAAGIALNVFIFKAREQAIESQLERTRMMVEIMAHEVKSPLAISYSYTITVRNLIALGTIKYAEKNVVITLPADIFKDLREFTNLSVNVAAYGVKTIDSLLLNMQESLGDIELEPILVLKCATVAVNNYISDHNSYTDRITINISPDFQMIGVNKYIKQLLLNLISNAFYYGKGRVKVRIYNKGRNLIVEDDGCSVPPSIAPFIFHRSYLPSQNLAFCKMVIEAFGGSIYCESEARQFTRFIIKIPEIEN